MRRLNQQAGYTRIVPLLAALSMLTGTFCSAQESFPNELNSPIDEPLVVIPENPQKVPVRPASAAIQASTDPLVKLVYDTREAQRQRLLSTTDHTPWQMMHGLLGLRQDFLINHEGKTVSGLDWIRTGPMFNNEPWFEKTQFGGRAHPYNKPYWFEGHINQSLAILATCNLPLDTSFGTPQGPITMRDMLKNAQMTVNEKEEVTWTLWALSTYLPSDAEWVNAKGERWSIERLVQIETGKKVGGPTSPCGGTHGLYALARARNVYLRTGKPLRGVWLSADQKIQRHIQTAKQFQNQNGTLSSNFFRGREYKQDFDKRMASSGHVLEFLMMAMPQERLKEQWVRRAIEATANDLMANRKAYVSCSPLYHATNALTIYLERVMPPGQQAAAQVPSSTTAISSSRNVPADASSSKTVNTTEPSPAATASGSPASGEASSSAKMEPKPAVGTPADPGPDSAKPAVTVEKAGTPTPAAPVAGTASGKDLVIPAPSPAPSPSNGGPIIQIPLPDPADMADPQAPAGSPPTVPEATQPSAPVAAPPTVPMPSPLPELSAVPATTSPTPTSIPAPVPALSIGATPPSTPVTASSAGTLMPTPQEDTVPAVTASVPAPKKTEPSVSAVLVPEAPKALATAPIPTYAVSADQSGIKTGQRDSVPVVISPTPLIRTPEILFVPGADKASLPVSQSTLQSSSPTKVLPAPLTPSTVALPAVDDLKALPTAPAPKSYKEGTPEPLPAKRLEWKSTPLERRKMIVFEEPSRV